MRTPYRKNGRHRRFYVCLALLPLSAFFAAPQPGSPPEPIGRLLTSDPVAIEGRTSWISPSEEYEEPSPQVFSGNKITLYKGIALLQFDDASGMVGFCGRTSLTIIKSKGAPLYALSSGTLSLDMSSSTVARILTPEFAVEWKASSVPGKKQGVVSFDAKGALCVQNMAGNVRVSNQLSGLSTDVPTGSSVQLRSGQTANPPLLKGLECGCSASFPLPPIPTGLGRGPGSDAVKTLERSPSVLVTATDESDRQRPPPEPDNPQRSSPVRLPVQTTPPPITLSQSSELPPRSDSSTAPPPGETPSMTTATLAVSAENMAKPMPKNSFGQKVKNFFRTVFFMKRKNPSSTPPPAQVQRPLSHFFRHLPKSTLGTSLAFSFALK